MKSKKSWETLSKVKIQDSGIKIQELIEVLLENRGLKTEKEIDEFLHPKLEEVTVDSVGIDKKQLSKALKRIEQAIEKKEKIVVYGDYDVDGITGTAILWESLHALGANIIPYIPHRVDEGYGLSIKGITNILQQLVISSESEKSQKKISHSVRDDTQKDSSEPKAHQNDKVSLIITVDNGIVANEAVSYANENGIDVIITDHHTTGEKIPDAYAIVHTTALCGAGVGWLFSSQFSVLSSQKDISQSSDGQTDQRKTDQQNSENRKQITENRITDHLSLVALATVADLVPLTGANRTLLKFGLEILRQTKRPGLLALFQEAKIETDKIDVYTIGHGIAPRLNAMGRLESAMDSLRILCTKDPKRAKELAQKLETTNKDRQVLTSSAIEHAKQQVINLSKKVKILIIEHDSYEEGIIGLVAGKLVETFYLPAIVISKKEGVSKASARSIAGFNIIETIRKASHLLVNAGGHPMAAGFSIETEKIELLKEALEQIADGAIDETMLKRVLRIDMELPLEIVNKKLFQEIQKLAPFGMASPEPVFVSEVVVTEVRQIGMEGKHLKMKVSPRLHRHPELDSGSHEIADQARNDDKNNSQNSNDQKLEIGNWKLEIEAIAFGMGEYIADLKKGTHAKIAYVIDENTWNGKTNLQLKIKDIENN